MNAGQIRFACAGVPTTAFQRVFAPGIAWLPYVDSSSRAFYAVVLTALRRSSFWLRDFGPAESAAMLILFCPPGRTQRRIDEKRARLGLPPALVVNTIEKLQHEISGRVCSSVSPPA